MDTRRSPQETELERRVLAHERVLQALVAFMSISEPSFLEHLRQRFVEPMKMSRREQDYTDVDDYAEQFVRAIMQLGEIKGESAKPSQLSGAAQMPGESLERSQSARVEIHLKDGIWHVTVDGVFWGDFREKQHAYTAMTLAKLFLAVESR